jgi:hypothetical protein
MFMVEEKFRPFFIIDVRFLCGIVGVEKLKKGGKRDVD